MRRGPVLALALLSVYLLVQFIGFDATTVSFTGPESGESFASRSREPSALPSRHAAQELRIDITRSAVQAQTEHDSIMARFSGDRAAQQWVADCAEQGLRAGEDVVSGDLSAEIERFCWRQYASDRR